MARPFGLPQHHNSTIRHRQKSHQRGYRQTHSLHPTPVPDGVQVVEDSCGLFARKEFMPPASLHRRNGAAASRS